MPKIIDQNISNKLKSLNTSAINLVEGFWDTGIVRLTNFSRNLIWNNNEYISAGHLLSIGEIEETNKFEAVQSEISLSGLDKNIKALVLTEQFVYNPLKIYFALLDETTDQIIHEPILIFYGLMDGMSMCDDFEEATSTINIALTSHLGRFEDIKGRKTNPSEQRNLYPNDSIFDSVPKLTEKIINW